MKRVLCALALLLCAAPAIAHHGKDFLIVESYELPHPHEIYFVSSEMFSRADGENFFTTEPSLLFGLTPRFAGEVHVHFVREPGESLHYEAVAPAVHVQLTSLGRWKFAAAAEYEIARHSDENEFDARLIAAHSIGEEGQLVINVGKHARYAVGFRPQMESRTAFGIEAEGRIERGEEHQVILGFYTQPSERFTFKAGAGAGLGVGKPSTIVRTGVVWHF
jgi:hypothetical protein